MFQGKKKQRDEPVGRCPLLKKKNSIILQMFTIFLFILKQTNKNKKKSYDDIKYVYSILSRLFKQEISLSINQYHILCEIGESCMR